MALNYLFLKDQKGSKIGLSETPSVVRNNLNDWVLYAKDEIMI